MIVLDASAVVELLLRLPRADEVQQRMTGPALNAPHLLPVEVTHVLRRLAQRGDLTAERGQEALADLAALDAEHYAHEPLLPTVWRLRHDVTAYDAVYVALAQALDAPLLTLDAKLAATAARHCDVDLVI